MIFIAVSLLWLVIAFVSFRYPGAGLATAAAIGRFEFPYRSDAIVRAGPFIILAAFLGLYVAQQGRVKLRAPESAIVVAMLASYGTVVLLLTGSLNDIGFERLTTLLFYVVPLALLAGAMEKQYLQEFRIYLVRIAFVLGSVSLIAGSADPTGRSAALGGGPIPLAQLSMMGFLIVLMFDDLFVPFGVPRWCQRAARILLGIVFVLVALRTASRFPVLAVPLSVILAAVCITFYEGGVRSVYRVLRRFAPLTIPLLVLAGFGISRVLSDTALTRYGLLFEDLGGELQRSRGDLFSYAWTQVVEHFPIGFGPGGFAALDVGVFGELTYPHNIYLEIAGDYGLFGIVLFFGLLAMTFLSRENRVGDRRLILLGLYAFSIALTSGDLPHNRYFFLWAGLIMASRRIEASRADRVDQGVDKQTISIGKVLAVSNTNLKVESIAER